MVSRVMFYLMDPVKALRKEVVHDMVVVPSTYFRDAARMECGDSFMVSPPNRNETPYTKDPGFIDPHHPCKGPDPCHQSPVEYAFGDILLLFRERET